MISIQITQLPLLFDVYRKDPDFKTEEYRNSRVQKQLLIETYFPTAFVFVFVTIRLVSERDF